MHYQEKLQAEGDLLKIRICSKRDTFLGRVYGFTKGFDIMLFVSAVGILWVNFFTLPSTQHPLGILPKLAVIALLIPALITVRVGFSAALKPGALPRVGSGRRIVAQCGLVFVSCTIIASWLEMFLHTFWKSEIPYLPLTTPIKLLLALLILTVVILLLLVMYLYWAWIALTQPRYCEIDRGHGVISYRNKPAQIVLKRVPLNEIQRVEVFPTGDNRYKIRLHLSSGQSVSVGESDSAEEAAQVADRISTFISVDKV